MCWSENMDLSRIESIVTIIAAIIAPFLTILTWLVTREKFVDFWKKWFKRLLSFALVISIILLAWRIGWLNWLSNQITWPIWGFILFAIGVLLTPVLIFLLILFLEDKNKTGNDSGNYARPDYYVIYGARWYFTGYNNNFERPPVCANCLMEMRNTSMPDYLDSVESWECRQCGHRIHWDVRKKGGLLADVAAHYNSELRHRQEVVKKRQ